MWRINILDNLTLKYWGFFFFLNAWCDVCIYSFDAFKGTTYNVNSDENKIKNIQSDVHKLVYISILYINIQYDVLSINI